MTRAVYVPPYPTPSPATPESVGNGVLRVDDTDDPQRQRRTCAEPALVRRRALMGFNNGGPWGRCWPPRTQDSLHFATVGWWEARCCRLVPAQACALPLPGTSHFGAPRDGAHEATALHESLIADALIELYRIAWLHLQSPEL